MKYRLTALSRLLLLMAFAVLCTNAQITRQQCYQCHANSTLQKTITVSGGTEVVPLYVDSTQYNLNTHHTLECVQCHVDIDATNLYTHANGDTNALSKTYGSWARFSKSDTTLNADGSPRTRNYYTAASMSCAKFGCHATRSGFDTSRHHTIWRLKQSHLKTVNGESVGEAYDKTCSRCHTTCATCHFKTSKTQKYVGDVLAIWDSLQTFGETPFPNASAMTEWAMDWTINVASHEFDTTSQLQAGNDVCRSCHVGYYRPATYGYLSENPPYPKANGTSIKRHPQYYEWSKSNVHKTKFCVNCHTDVHSYPDGDFDWQAQGDAKCQTCHTMANHYANHTTVDCISCHFIGFAKSVGQDGHDVWRWPVNNRVRPLAVKYKEALSWYPHNIVKPDSTAVCASKCHYAGNILGASVITSIRTSDEHPSTFVLQQNHPNPFNPVTRIRYQLPEAGHVKIQIYNTIGTLVTTLVDRYQEAGYYTATWDGVDNGRNSVASGIYIYKMETKSFTSVKKMVLMR